MGLMDQYLIKEDMQFMSGVHDRFGKLCTYVKRINGAIMVNRSPREILEDSIQAIGYDLRGAWETSRKFSGATQMRPIMVNPVSGIVLFPTKSIDRPDVIWINPIHIVRTRPWNRKTIVMLTCGLEFTVNVSLPALTTKMAHAEQLRRFVLKNAQASKLYSMFLDHTKRHPRTMTLYLDPRTRKKQPQPLDESNPSQEEQNG